MANLLKTSRLQIRQRLRRRSGGFIYIGLLVLVAIFGLGSVGAARILASSERLERETELLFVGAQIRSAIASYYTSSPGTPRYPDTLEQLLQDPRFPVVRRHLRQIYTDPISGDSNWGLVKAPEGGIMGVYSLSTREPLKRTGFESPNQTLNDLGTRSRSTSYAYRDWQFIFAPARSNARR